MGAPRRSPLHACHEEAGAVFAEFAGWSMPVQYAGVLAEHQAVREQAGLFDVSHLGTLEVVGAAAADLLQRTFTNDLSRIGDGQAQYTLCCNDDGGVLDDLIVYRLDGSTFVLVPNAANAAAVRERLLVGAAEDPPGAVTVGDRHHETAIVAVQGPASDDVLAAVGLPAGHSYMSLVSGAFDASVGPPAEVTVCRTGYTGERGYELMLQARDAPSLWRALRATASDTGLVPCGLGARDTLRTEMGYPLHGQDLGPDITPLQARLSWAIGWDSGPFAGREALLRERAQGVQRRLWGVRSAGRAIPRPGTVVRQNGRDVGAVTSGTFSPSRRVGIGLALLEPDIEPGDTVVLDLRGREVEVQVTRPPFVDRNPAAA